MERIRSYLEKLDLGGKMVERYLAEFARHKDLAEEFEAWIEQGEGEFPDGIRVEGYSAKQIKELAPFMNGCGVYDFLVSLREKPETALSYIAEGFPIY